MTLQSLQSLMKSVETRAQSKSQRTFQAVCDRWSEVAGPMVAEQSRPVGLQRKVLSVATSSAVWAQTLSFERVRLLHKLNQAIAPSASKPPLLDIRFSTAQWRSKTAQTWDNYSEVLSTWQQHPSRLLSPAQVRSPATCKDAMTAFHQWSTRIQSRSQQMPLCPACQCPTPPGELQRWNVCSLCAAKQW
jgi:predicted nucleic acid-binding Zn ribbon protein